LLRCLARGATAWEDVQESHRDPATTIAKTLYFCLQERYEIAYGREPHYYGKDWQAIRFPAGVLDELEGTCIDLALLFASCLEDRSLCPLIVILETGIHPEGYPLQHALVGCWKETSLRWNRFRPSKPVEKSGQRILHWLKEGDLILLDPIGFAHGKDADQLFSKSLKSARNYLERACARQLGHAFCYAVDIEVARLEGFQPLPVGAEIVFDRSSWLTLSRARQEAEQRGSPAVGGRHLLLGLLSLENGVLRQALTRRGPDLPDRVAEQARSNLGSVVKTGSRPPWKKTENLELVLNAAKERPRRDGRRLVADEDLAIALLENHKKVRGVLEEAGVTPAQCLDEVRGVLLAGKDRPVSSVPDV
jgi:Clp amino terminal domain, pathogenicity island component